MATKFRTLTEAQSAFDALEATHATTEASLTAAQAQAQANHAARLEAEVARDALVASNAKLFETNQALEASVSEEKLSRTAAEASQKQAQDALAEASRVTAEAVNRKASDILAAHGHKPLNIGADDLSGQSTGNKPKLKGRDLLVSAIESQMPKK